MNMIAVRKQALHARAAVLMVRCFLAVGCGTPGVKGGLAGYGFEEVGETNGSLFTGFLNIQQADPLFPNDKARLIFSINAVNPVDPANVPRLNATTQEVQDARGDLSKLELFHLQAHLQSALNNQNSTLERAKQLRNNMLSQLIGRSNSQCAAFTVSCCRFS